MSIDLVLIATAATCYALWGAVQANKKQDRVKLQKMFRYRLMCVRSLFRSRFSAFQPRAISHVQAAVADVLPRRPRLADPRRDPRRLLPQPSELDETKLKLTSVFLPSLHFFVPLVPLNP
jgi:hypothetical protein